MSEKKVPLAKNDSLLYSIIPCPDRFAGLEIQKVINPKSNSPNDEATGSRSKKTTIGKNKKMMSRQVLIKCGSGVAADPDSRSFIDRSSGSGQMSSIYNQYASSLGCNNCHVIFT